MIMLSKSLQGLDWGELIDLPSSRALQNTAHYIGGRYPCRSVAYVPRILLDEFRNEKSLNVLDPFMGSGTTAVEAFQRGFNAYGLEVDPFARLISEISTHSFTNFEKEEIKKVHASIVSEFNSCTPDYSFSPKVKNIEYWFEEINFLDLLKLKTLIHKKTDDDYVRRFFLTVMADIIRATSKAERQSLKPYISKRFTKKRNDVLSTFIKAFDKYFDALHSESDFKDSKKVSWLQGDATNFKSDVKMDIAITSPPYINAMDYVRCIKLESSWIDTGNDTVFKNVRKSQLGEDARVKQVSVNKKVSEIIGDRLKYLETEDIRRYKTALTYFQDMHDNLKSVCSALKTNACYHIIVGNSVIRSRQVDTHQMLAELACELGFSWDGYFTYPIKDHRTSLPRNGKGGKISVEHVITLRKQ